MCLLCSLSLFLSALDIFHLPLSLNPNFHNSFFLCVLGNWPTQTVSVKLPTLLRRREQSRKWEKAEREPGDSYHLHGFLLRDSYRLHWSRSQTPQVASLHCLVTAPTSCSFKPKVLMVQMSSPRMLHSPMGFTRVCPWFVNISLSKHLSTCPSFNMDYYFLPGVWFTTLVYFPEGHSYKCPIPPATRPPLNGHDSWGCKCHSDNATTACSSSQPCHTTEDACAFTRCVNACSLMSRKRKCCRGD